MPDKIDELHDWDVRIPLHTGRNDRGDFDVVVRVPAATRADAIELAEPIALHIAQSTKTAVNLADLDPVDVDGEPSVAELAYTLAQREQELAYQKKVLAGLAGKYPMLITLTKEEYDAADPDGVTAMIGPDGESMVFMVAATAAAVTAPDPDQGEPILVPGHDHARRSDLGEHRGRGRQIFLNKAWQPLDDLDGGFYDLDPDKTFAVRDAQPELEGGGEDPDVRRVRARNVGVFGEAIDVLVAGRWRRLTRQRMLAAGRD